MSQETLDLAVGALTAAVRRPKPHERHRGEVTRTEMCLDWVKALEAAGPSE